MRLHPGEVEASGWRVETLLDVVQLLHDASPGVNGRPRVMAIDGRGGAGKSTLVERMRRLVSRDGDSAAQQQHVADWLAEELPFLRRERPWENATLVADGTTQLRHDPDSELVVAPHVGPRT